MKKAIIAFIALMFIAIIVISVVPSVAAMYNDGNRKFYEVSKVSADLDAMYQKRYDLVDNLVEIARGYGEFEKSTLQQVIAARYNAAKDPSVQNQSALSRLLVVFEKYPTLETSQHYAALSAELISLENQIQEARIAYNTVANDFNVYITSFPNNILTSFISKWHQMDLYKIDDASRKEVEQARKIKIRG